MICRLPDQTFRFTLSSLYPPLFPARPKNGSATFTQPESDPGLSPRTPYNGNHGVSQSQSAQDALGSGLLLFSIEELTSFRLRRQPTGLTLGSFLAGGATSAPLGQELIATAASTWKPRRPQAPSRDGPQSQSAQDVLGAVALLVSVDSFVSFRLRRQPTGLTFNSLPRAPHTP